MKQKTADPDTKLKCQIPIFIGTTRRETLSDWLRKMNVYIVSKDDVPCCVTCSEQEAFGEFDRSVRTGGYRHASVDVVVASTNSRRVLQEAFGAQSRPV